MTSPFPDEFSYLDQYLDRPINTIANKNLSAMSEGVFNDYFTKKYAHLDYNVCNIDNPWMYIYNNNTMSISLDTNFDNIHKLDDHKRYCIIFNDNNVYIKLPQKDILLKNIDKIQSRYYPMEFSVINKTKLGSAAHTISVIFDKKDKQVIIIDSNGDFKNYFAQMFDDPPIARLHFHLAIQLVFNEMDYSYIPLLEQNLDTIFNKQNEEINYLNTGGYCSQWSLIMCELLMNSDNNISPNTIIQKIGNMSNFQRNQLINAYSHHLYGQFENSFKKMNGVIEKLYDYADLEEKGLVTRRDIKDYLDSVIASCKR